MRPVIKTVILLLILAAVGGVLYTAIIKNKQPLIQTGKPAPEFIAKDLNGKEVRLSQLKGKGIILNFWGTWCVPCREEMPTLEQISKEYADKGIMVLAVNNGESLVTVKGFADQYKLTFPILLDPKLDISRAYQVITLPTTYFIKPDGTVAKKIVGGPISRDVILDNIKQMGVNK